MLVPKRAPIHPGEILQEEFLKPLGITQTQLAADIGVPIQRVNLLALMRPSGGATMDVFQPMIWSPENRAPAPQSGPSSAKHKWSGRWPGVWTAVTRQPLPAMLSPSARRMSGTKGALVAFAASPAAFVDTTLDVIA